jgi:LAO/AO transport system kinase
MAGTLLDALLAGDARALARALTLVERGGEEADALLAALPAGGTAHRIGITGPPGAGKSTLVSALTTCWRQADKRVGILAVDPSSPFTGGALLGDRIRMQAHQGDPDVFIRSLASRGTLGGLSPHTQDAADVLAAAGCDPVVIETVGVGQGEVEICRAADTTVVVLAPGSGDEIQGMKAGLLEAADVIVVNQSDRAGAEQLEAALAVTLEMRDAALPRPPVFRTVATAAEGVPALAGWLDARGAVRDEGAVAERRETRIRARIEARVAEALARRFWAGRPSALADAIQSVARGEAPVGEVVRRLLQDGSQEGDS